MSRENKTLDSSLINIGKKTESEITGQIGQSMALMSDLSYCFKGECSTIKGQPQEKVVKCQTEQVKTQNKHIYFERNSFYTHLIASTLVKLIC